MPVGWRTISWHEQAPLPGGDSADPALVAAGGLREAMAAVNPPAARGLAKMIGAAQIAGELRALRILDIKRTILCPTCGAKIAASAETTGQIEPGPPPGGFDMAALMRPMVEGQ